MRAEWLGPQTPDLEGSSFSRRVISLDKKLFSTLFLFTYCKCIIGYGDILLGGDPAMGYLPVQGVVEILLGMLYAKEADIAPAVWGFGSCAPLPYLT